VPTLTPGYGTPKPLGIKHSKDCLFNLQLQKTTHFNELNIFLKYIQKTRLYKFYFINKAQIQ
jgi:hypothetical protein